MGWAAKAAAAARAASGEPLRARKVKDAFESAKGHPLAMQTLAAMLHRGLHGPAHAVEFEQYVDRVVVGEKLTGGYNTRLSSVFLAQLQDAARAAEIPLEDYIAWAWVSGTQQAQAAGLGSGAAVEDIFGLSRADIAALVDADAGTWVSVQTRHRPSKH